MTRVMWLLNHKTARKFEIPMLKRIGINEIFLPKIFPQSISFRSADVDFSEDKNLTISANELEILNKTNWYADNIPEAAWEIANKHFNVLFFIANSSSTFKNIKRFKGAAVWRAYGLDSSLSYTLLLQHLTKGVMEKPGANFWFGQAYDHLHEIESPYLRDRKIDLPLGLNPITMNDQWEGHIRKLLFICPDIGFNSYYQKLYTSFRKSFGDFPYVCGGAQAINFNDSNVLGYVPNEVHENNMRQMRVMFYHSTEPNHIHYHPFEAIRAGMPLVFMGGGLLDRMGGKNLPGRCTSIKEARKKIKRILNDDNHLIEAIRQSQLCLLKPMHPDYCEQKWRDGFVQILKQQEEHRLTKKIVQRKKRIAVILPIAYSGGTLEGTKLLANALWEGSQQCGEDAEIIFAYPDDPKQTHKIEFDLPSHIKLRLFKWKTLNADAAYRAMVYAGHAHWQSLHTNYVMPDDGINQFMDCDLWMIVSDRLSSPLLPIRPYMLMVYDYLQRRVPVIGNDQFFINAARDAAGVLVTTNFTKQDALQYAGLSPEKVHHVPLLSPKIKRYNLTPLNNDHTYFLWPTNLAQHKNHVNALNGLKIYYDELDGKLECHVTGVNTHKLLKSELHHLASLSHMMENSIALKKYLKIYGELHSSAYQRKLADAAFLWHPAQLDNGTFCVLEAAHLGISSLSSDYPAMKEIDTQFKLNLFWMRSDCPKNMAKQLKMLEENVEKHRSLLPSKELLAEQNIEKFAKQYWKVVKLCL